MMKTLLPLINPVQHYSWGSGTAIPDILGIKNDENVPFAELWIGAHPKAPSRAVTERGKVPLNELIAGNPPFFLGKSVIAAHGGGLPFLLKILAAREPLSIQVHPNLEQARTGFNEEEERGIPVDAPERNYRDRNHKPEMIRALTPFIALCGFREREEILDNFSSLEAAGPLVRAFTSGGSCRDFFTGLMSLPEDTKNLLLSQALAMASERDDGVGQWVILLAESYGNDIGVIAPYILNLINLAPGEALFLDAGVLHSYLQGTGIELMASSDNVLRGGLTTKHIDVQELLKVLDFSCGRPGIINPEPSGYEDRYPVRAAEFSLSVFSVGEPDSLPIPGSDGPEIFLCTEGRFSLCSGDEEVTVAGGQAVFAAAAAGALKLEGSGRVFRAFVPGKVYQDG